jgi:transcriptional regulator with XRE-family HTH domain
MGSDDLNKNNLENYVLELFESGLTRYQISRKLKGKRSFVDRVIRGRNRNISQNRKAIFERKLEEGCKSLEELCFHLNCKSPNSLYDFCKDEGLEYPRHLEPWDYRPDISELMEVGFNQREIAKKLNVTSQMISLYLILSLKIVRYREIQVVKKSNRGNVIDLRKSRKTLVTLLNIRKRELELEEFVLKNDIDKTSFAYRKLCEFRREHPRVKAYSLNQLYRVFLMYQEGLGSDEKPTYDEMKDFAGLKFFSDVQNIFGFVGLKSFNKNMGIRLSKEQKDALENALELNLSGSSIAYYIGCDFSYVSLLRNERSIRYEFEYLINSGNEKLTHHVASQIYEAKDADFSDDDTLELIDGCSQRKIDYAVENRGEIEGFIINCLRHMFPLRNIDKGYL